MKKDLIHSLTNTFESHAQKTEEGIEFWLARDLQQLLGYSEWRNFIQTALSKAKTACELSGEKVDDHFVDVNKLVEIGSGSGREISDTMLTRYACYLIAQNGDSRKEEIAFAQTYFAYQTRKVELIEKRLLDSERLSARKKLTETEKELSSVIYQHTGSDKYFGAIRSKGDKALFNLTTQEIKERWKVPPTRPLADFAPTIILKAKDFATEITIFNTKEKGLSREKDISQEHETNHTSVRHTLISRGIVPENLPAEPDIKKIERKLQSDVKQGLKNPDILPSL
jgi:DNA-damage-inducible protein D